LLRAVKEYFGAGRLSDEGYLRPQKRLLPDIYVSKDTLSRAVEIANQLFLELEQAGCAVRLAAGIDHCIRPELDQRAEGGPYPLYQTWRPTRPTVVYVGDVAIAGRRAEERGDEDSQRMVARLKRARALLGGIDPLKYFEAWRAPEDREPSFLEEV
jgi:hypothetical protein